MAEIRGRAVGFLGKCKKVRKNNNNNRDLPTNLRIGEAVLLPMVLLKKPYKPYNPYKAQKTVGHFLTNGACFLTITFFSYSLDKSEKLGRLQAVLTGRSQSEPRLLSSF
jgi:hypothetical protein